MVTRLRVERMQSGHTLLEASKALRISDSLLSGIERGRMACPEWLRLKLALFVGKKPEELFDRHGFPIFIE